MAVIRFFSGTLTRRILGIILALIFLAGASLLLIYGTDPYHLRMAQGVQIGSVDVSGMTRREARRALAVSLEESLYSHSLELQLPEETLLLSPDVVQPAVDTDGALQAAWNYGRKDGQTEKEIDLLSYLQVNETAIRGLLARYADQYNTTLTQPKWTLEGAAPNLSTLEFQPEQPCQTLYITRGLPQTDLDQEQTFRQILQTLAQAPDLCSNGTYRLAVEVIPSALPQLPDVDSIWESVCQEAVNDSLDLNTYQRVNGQYGYAFDRELLLERIDDAQYGETVAVPLFYVTPEILGDQVYFRDVLGTCETKHNNNENRNTNLRLLCAAMDGFVLQPGETFSYNAVVGERTREKGYLPAPAYSGNRLTDSVGGGVCQGSTTLYNCVLLADLEVVFRACHGASVNYVPPGLDAAVNYLTTDFQFRNNFHFPIMIRAEVSDGYVKMKILGTDEKDYYIKMESRYGEDDIAVYARSYKCRYSKQTGELLSRDLEAYSTYYKDIG